MGDSPIEELYEQVRAVVAATADAPQSGLAPVAPGIRVLALRTPTLPPAAHTNVYLVGPEAGPVAVVDPGSPYPEEQAILDALLAEIPIARVLLMLAPFARGVSLGSAVPGKRARNRPGHTC